MNNRALTAEEIKSQRVEEVFYYYDKPILYSCWINDKRYLVYWVDESLVEQKWFYVAISPCLYARVLSNDVPLYSLFLRAEDGYVTQVVITNNDDYRVEVLPSHEIDLESLPNTDCYLTMDKPLISPSK